ncbi:MAG: hypothetical protein A2V91_04035 [Candidatus Muproteobacteria bacterium RBG_16_64_10]|uniref:Sel1 repeat family protein n=1 Tax=Candidatus Muproteobacteria bacterium RBG_16_64_10 TaxID=1817757 RepID=A0A1F6SWZ6_9PROT|nr:MAG: hypothetical protein A2V91_04035 [Candidatus Muproteobacteria bacterium RBG_16_64_10]
MKRHLLAAFLLFLASSPLLAAEDPEQLKSLKRAAESGDVSAQYEIGVLYEFGFRMKTHLIPALAWYMVSADNGDPRAIKRRDQLMSQLKPEQVDEAKRLRAGFGAKKPAAAKPDAEPAKPAEDQPAPEPAKPAPEKPKPAPAPVPETPPAKPAEEKPKPAAAAKPVMKKPEPKPESPPASPAPSSNGPAVQPLLPPPPSE